MRGRTKSTTRYSAFRKSMLEKFKTEEGITSEFIAFVRGNERLDWAFVLYCDEDESLRFMEPGYPTALYQILRLANRLVLLRELEPLSDFIWGNREGKQSLYTALCVLQAVNLIDYQTRDFEGSPSNILQFFVKEDV
jgi:hypothetical protein